METFLLSAKVSNKCFLREPCGKELSRGNLYLVPNSTNRNRNSLES